MQFVSINNIHNHTMSNEQNAGKRKPVGVFVADDEKDFIDEACGIEHLNRGEFMRRASLKEAERSLGRHLNEHLNGAKAA